MKTFKRIYCNAIIFMTVLSGIITFNLPALAMRKGSNLRSPINKEKESEQVAKQASKEKGKSSDEEDQSEEGASSEGGESDTDSDEYGSSPDERFPEKLQEVVLSSKKDFKKYCRCTTERTKEETPCIPVVKVKFVLTNKDLNHLIQVNPDIEELEISDCENITDINALSNLHKLRSLRLQKCIALKDLTVLLVLNLTTLELVGCPGIRSSDIFANLTRLNTLDLTECNNLEEIDNVAKLENCLITLKLKNCRKLQNINGVQNLKRITNLDLSHCDNLSGIEPVRGLTTLQDLRLSGAKLVNLSMLLGLQNLIHLKLNGCTGLSDIEDIQYLQKLQILNLNCCINLEQITPLSKLPNLTHLYLRSCTGLKNFCVFKAQNIATLFILDLAGCTELGNLDDLSELKNLTYLSLKGCTRLNDIAGLSNLENLLCVDLTRCQNIEDIIVLHRLRSLEKISLSESTYLPRKTILELERPDLEIVIEDDLDRATTVDTVAIALESCTIVDNDDLRKYLSNCKEGRINSTGVEVTYSITNKQLLSLARGNPNIQSLSIKDGKKLRNVDALEPLSSLTSLTLHNCPKLKSIKVLPTLKHLAIFKITEYPKKLQSKIQQLKEKKPDLTITAIQKPMTHRRRADSIRKMLGQKNRDKLK